MDEAGPAFSNVYDDDARASAYAALEYPGTYYLAFRDLPAIIAAHVSGREALDFGCGAGLIVCAFARHVRHATGIDISASMIRLARSADPAGAYHQVGDGDFGPLGDRRFDLVLSAFAFDNIPGAERRRDLLRGLGGLLAPGGRIVLLGSTPEIYWHEWASFTTRDFPENRAAKSGERVRIIMKDVTDRRPVVDCIWFPEDYLATFSAASLRLLAQHRPLGRGDEGREWISETTVAPWVIYVLERAPVFKQASRSRHT